MHKLLLRQLKRHLGMAQAGSIPQDWLGFIEAVDAAYTEADVDRTRLERSMDLTSQELLERNRLLRQDILERQRAEAALRESEQRYRAVVQQASESIFLVDAGTKKILEANAAFQKLLG